MEGVPNVRLLVEAYSEMLHRRASRSAFNISESSTDHYFYDRQAIPKSKSRFRPYRQSPADKRWLTWDTAEDSRRWLSDPNIRDGSSSPAKSLSQAKEKLKLHFLDAVPSDDGCHSDLSPSPTPIWHTGPQSTLNPGENYTSLASSPFSCSIDDFSLSRSISCSNICPVKTSRSMSEDSAVDVSALAASIDSSAESRELSRYEYTEQWSASSVHGVEDRDDSECSNTKVKITPPAVVISDYSGDTVSLRVALLTDDFKLSSISRQASFVTEPLSEFGLSVSKVCPRKVSDCSTCSSVSTVDMSPECHLTLDDFASSRRSSCCSNCSTYTAADSTIEEESILEEESASDQPTEANSEQARQAKRSLKTSNWRKVKNVVQWTPFIQTYKRHKYPWVQLAGHQGNFKAGEKQGTILKKLCPAEQRALERLMKDVLKPYVPEYMGLVESGDQEQYLQLQDLLSDFNAPCVMDIKMGVRTYLEDELAKAREKPKLRKDMYEKMIQIDPNAPSEAEQRAQAVTKPRYMVWRETISSTATLGFRIEGVKKSDGSSSKDFKTTRSQDQVLTSLISFVNGYDHAPGLYLKRLKEIRTTLESSAFFMSHELIGSSLLFVHNDEHAVVWLIDFAKSIPLPSGVTITHRAPWIEGSHEDGYLLGLDNVIKLMATLEQQQQIKKNLDAQLDLKASQNESQPQPESAEEQEPSKVADDNETQTASTIVTQKEQSSVHENESKDCASDSSSSLNKNHTEESKDHILNSTNEEPPSNKDEDKTPVTHPSIISKALSRHYINCNMAEVEELSQSTTTTATSNDTSSTINIVLSSPSDSHSPTDFRNLVKSSAETNSIS